MTDVTQTHDAGQPGPVVKTTPDEGGAHHDHPSQKQYIYVALLLAGITLAEVLVYYVESLGVILNYILIVMSVIKFAIVVLWFMHLRFDSRLFRRLFVTGIVLTFFGNRYWTYAHKRSHGKEFFRETWQFLFWCLLGLGIQEGIQAATYYGLGLKDGISYNVVTALGIGIATVFRFWAYRTLVFTGQSLAPVAESAEELEPEPAP